MFCCVSYLWISMNLAWLSCWESICENPRLHLGDGLWVSKAPCTSVIPSACQWSLKPQEVGPPVDAAGMRACDLMEPPWKLCAEEAFSMFQAWKQTLGRAPVAKEPHSSSSLVAEISAHAPCPMLSPLSTRFWLISPSLI